MQTFTTYFLVAVCFIGALLSFREAFKPKKRKTTIEEVNYIPPKNYGRGFFIFTGCILLYAGIKLLK